MRMPFFALNFALGMVLGACTPAPPQSAERAQQEAPDAFALARQARVANLPPPYNAASYVAGRRAFAQCRSCHTLEAAAPHRVGPNLHGLFGREVGSAQNFTYSQALLSAGFTWDAVQLDAWLANPQDFLPGNRMAFVGVRDATQRRDLIAYLKVATTAE